MKKSYPKTQFSYSLSEWRQLSLIQSSEFEIAILDKICSEIVVQTLFVQSAQICCNKAIMQISIWKPMKSDKQ